MSIEISPLQVNQIATADALDYLRTLPDASIQCCITSPPYFQMRDYGVQGQVGNENTVTAYVGRLNAIFHEVKRVLKVDGVCWLNIGDTYAQTKWGNYQSDAQMGKTDYISISGIPNKRSKGELPDKNLLGVPWRLAFALQDDGWILRADCIWHKPSCLPASVKDRPTRDHEYVFLFSKSTRYHLDMTPLQQPADPASARRANRAVSNTHKNLAIPGQSPHSLHKARAHGEGYAQADMRNRRTVWTVASEPSNYECCLSCHTLLIGEQRQQIKVIDIDGKPEKVCPYCKRGDKWIAHYAAFPQALIEPLLAASCPADGIVLDPFMGSGTTGIVAKKLNRNYVGCDVNPAYVALATARIARNPYKAIPLANGLSQLSLFETGA